MRGNIDLDHEWRLACLKADGELSEHGDELVAGLSDTSPFSLDELTAAAFDIDEAISPIRPRA
jgi:hypothetical protein